MDGSNGWTKEAGFELKQQGKLRVLLEVLVGLAVGNFGRNIYRRNGDGLMTGNG